MDLFSKSYAFLDDVRVEETRALQAELGKEKDPGRRAQLQQLLSKRVWPSPTLSFSCTLTHTHTHYPRIGMSIHTHTHKNIHTHCTTHRMRGWLMAGAQQQQARQAERRARQEALVRAHKQRERELVRQGKQPYYLKKGAAPTCTYIHRERRSLCGAEAHAPSCLYMKHAHTHTHTQRERAEACTRTH
jgi:hypothetical protein